eukprot:1185926-Prorocentrum_minimum.AAC.2
MMLGTCRYGEDATMKRLLVLERAKKQVKVFLVDLIDTTAYTNVLGTQEAATLSYEALTPDQFEATYGSTIKTVPKQLVFDTATTDGWDYSAKQARWNPRTPWCYACLTKAWATLHVAVIDMRASMS